MADSDIIVRFHLVIPFISMMTTDNFCFYLQNRLIQSSQTGGQWYSDTSPFSIPCLSYHELIV
jgi:hypothetical protein